MKILVTYSSKTGNTKRLAEAIYAGLEAQDKEIKTIKEVANIEEYDIIFVGYWVDRGGANQEAKDFMTTIKGKKVGIFATLGYWPDSKHAITSLDNGQALVEEDNEVIVRYICQGALAPAIIERFKSFPEGDPHAVTPAKLKRYEIASQHPSPADMALGAELFNERVRSLYV